MDISMMSKSVITPGKVYKPSEPYRGRILENTRITAADSVDDVRHIVIDIDGSGMSYIEGQSVGVIPPGTQENGKRHRPRLYSISSSRNGDDGTSGSVSLTVKRVSFTDPESGKTVKGVASNFLCDLTPGDTLELTGPVGRTFFLPEDDHVNLIMIAVGTGIAPFRAFVHHIFRERGEWKGEVRLFYGTKTGLESLYMNNENNDIGQYMEKETFRAFQALSVIDHIHVQRRLEENIDEIWSMLKQGNFAFYVCGIKGMEEGIYEILRKKALEEEINLDEMVEKFEKEGRWNIEVY